MGKKVLVYDPTASDKLSSVRGIGRYLQILKENFPDWIFSNNITEKHDVFINPFFNFLKPPIIFTKIAKKQIAVIHDLIPLKYPSHYPTGIKGSLYIFLNKFVLKNYDIIITDSEASKRDIINILKIKSEKLRVIYPCLPKSFAEPGRWKLGIETSYENGNKKMDNSASDIKPPNPLLELPSKFCIYVGDATWNKNLVNLARAIKLANVNCMFVGKVFQTSAVGERSGKTAEVNNGWQSELNEFLELTKDDKRFVFPGFIADDELIKFYKQASMNILPSLDEGFGFSYVESAQFGCPSLLSDISVLREISDGKAMFFDPNNPEDIAEKIKTIYSDKDLRNKIGIDAKKRSEFFSAEKFKKEFMSVIPA